MEMRPFGFDPLTGAIETFYYDHSNDTFTIERTEDVTGIIEQNHAWKTDVGNGNWRGDMHRVASIPLTVVGQLAKLGIMAPGGRVLDQKRLKRWLNSADNRVFRTKEGRV